jgi:hypothetical protein
MATLTGVEIDVMHPEEAQRALIALAGRQHGVVSTARSRPPAGVGP